MASLGEATGAVVPLALDDLPTPAGYSFLTKMLVEAGAPPSLYRDDGSGTLLEGDDEIAPGQDLTRIIYPGAYFQINDFPSADDIEAVFAAGGVGEAARVHLQTADEVQTFDVPDVNVLLAAGNFVRWDGLPTAFDTLVGSIAEGDRFILGIAIPDAVVAQTGDAEAIEATGELGEATGVVGAAATRAGDAEAVAATGELGEATGAVGAASARTGDAEAVEATGELGEATGFATGAGEQTASGAPIEATGSLGEATGTASAAPLVLADLPTPAGRSFVTKMLVEAGVSNLYQNQTDTDGTLIDGDDVFSGTQALTRIRWADPVLILNDNPSAEDLEAVFASGGAAEDARFHLQTDDGVQSFDIADVTLDASGGNFTRWSGLPAAWVTLVEGIASGDRFIFGVSVAITQTGDAEAIGATGELGEAAGTVGAAAARTGDAEAVAATGELGEATGFATGAGEQTGDAEAIAATGELGEATGTATAVVSRTGDAEAVEATGELGEATGAAGAAAARAGDAEAVAATGAIGEATGTSTAAAARTGDAEAIEAAVSLGEATGAATVVVNRTGDAEAIEGTGSLSEATGTAIGEVASRAIQPPPSLRFRLLPSGQRSRIEVPEGDRLSFQVRIGSRDAKIELFRLPSDAYWYVNIEHPVGTLAVAGRRVTISARPIYRDPVSGIGLWCVGLTATAWEADPQATDAWQRTYALELVTP